MGTCYTSVKLYKRILMCGPRLDARPVLACIVLYVLFQMGATFTSESKSWLSKQCHPQDLFFSIKFWRGNILSYRVNQLSFVTLVNQLSFVTIHFAVNLTKPHCAELVFIKYRSKPRVRGNKHKSHIKLNVFLTNITSILTKYNDKINTLWKLAIPVMPHLSFVSV